MTPAIKFMEPIISALSYFSMGFCQKVQQPSQVEKTARKASIAEPTGIDNINSNIKENCPDSSDSLVQKLPVMSAINRLNEVKDDDSSSSGVESETVSPRPGASRETQEPSAPKASHSSSTSVSDEGLGADSDGSNEASDVATGKLDTSNNVCNKVPDDNKQLNRDIGTGSVMTPEEPELPEGSVSTADFSYLKRVGKGGESFVYP